MLNPSTCRSGAWPDPGGRMSLPMMPRQLLVLGLIALVAPAEAADESPLTRGVGQRVANFTLPDSSTGEPVRLYGFRGKKAAVIVFTGTECPVGDLYMPRLKELAA